MEIYFKEGDIVAHMHNPNLPLVVIRVIKKKKTFITEGKSTVIREERMAIQGIECGWWGPDKQYYKNTFHSNSLVPIDIAEEGMVAIEKYIMQRAEYKMKEKEQRK